MSKSQRQKRVLCVWNSKKAGLVSWGRNCGNQDRRYRRYYESQFYWDDKDHIEDFFEQKNFMIDFRQMILAAFCSIRYFEEQLGRRNVGKLSPELVTVKG